MTNHRSFALAVLLALFLFSPSVAHPQRGAHTAGRVAPSRGAYPRIASARPLAHPARSAGARADRLVPGFNFRGTPEFFPNRNRDHNHDRDMAFRRRFGDRDFFPGGAYFLWDGGPEYAAPADTADDTAAYDQADQSQPQQQQQPEPAPDVAAEQPPAPQFESVPTAAPVVPGDDHLTLVLSNGDKIQAVAFTRANDSIVYITPGGLRRTLALTDIDTAATLRVNQEQGKFLQSSSL
jgi:hypothetical protein